MANKKVWFAAIPLALGAAVLLTLGGMTARRGSTGSTATKSNVATTIPQNPAHERAALEEQLKQTPDHPPILFRLAELEREAGRPKDAAPYLRRILEKDATNLDARLELGRVLYEAGDAQGAFAETQRLLRDHPNQVDGLYNLGAIYANQGRIDLARQFWQQALTVDPKSDSAQKARDGLARLGKP